MSRAKEKQNEIRVVNIRMVREPSLYSETPVSTPQDVMGVIAKEFATYDREVFGILNLKTNGQIINMNVCSIGTLNASMVNGRFHGQWPRSFQVGDPVKCRLIHLFSCASQRKPGAQRRG